MTEKTFGEALSERTAAIEAAVLRIADDRDAEASLNQLRVDLVEMLGLVERNPGIEAAADDLGQTASEFLKALRLDPASLLRDRRTRRLKAALQHLQDRLATAQPGEKAKQTGLL